jgi:hypothetical protein
VVSTDGEELPLTGFALVPADRLVLLEQLSTSARCLVSHHIAKEGLSVEAAMKDLSSRVSELEKFWDIPPSSELATPTGSENGA